MRAALRGERLNVLLVLLFIVLLVTTAVALSLTIGARSDAGTARHSAQADRAALLQVTAALRTQCAQQLVEQTHRRDLEQTDAELQRRLIAADARNKLITGTIRADRRAAYQRKLAEDLQFLTQPSPTPAVCAAFSQPLPIAFHADGP